MFVPAGFPLRPLALAALLMAALPATVRAGSSIVIKVNLGTVNTGGISPGDLPGFPVTITQPGAYELDGNLDLRSQHTPWNVNAIQVTADNVTINLKGFAIIGPAVCTGHPPVCMPIGTGDGISSTNNNIVVENGTIRGMGSDGIALANNVRVTNIRAIGNGGDGIAVLDTSIVENCTVQSNGDDGIQVGNTSTVRGNVVKDTKEQGIVALNASTVMGNSVFRSGLQGIFTIGACTVTGNTSVGQATSFGLSLGTGTGYGGNVLTDNNGPVGNNNPQVTGAGIQIAPNVCGTDTVCP